MNNPSPLFEKRNNTLKKIDNQRRAWLYASSAIVCSIILIIFAWDWIASLGSPRIWWVIGSILLIITVNWWYWTMKVVLHMSENLLDVMRLIESILGDIAEIKQQVKKKIQNKKRDL
jgi:hypothetical protein